jgi:HAD superfamily hydrolase (TIGR01662 family)
MKRILFTGVGRRVELIQAFRRAALVLKKEVAIFGADLDETAPALVYCDSIRKVAAMGNEQYIQNLLNICSNDHIDLLIPTIDTDLLALSENKEKFEAIGTKVMISSPEMVHICRNKNNTYRFFSDCGLCAPLPVDDWNEYKNGYPAFIKPKDGSSSINAFKIANIEELKMYAGQIRSYIIQPFIEGKEYTIDIFCDWDGTPISIVPRERIKVRAGEVLKTRIVMDEAMIDEAKRICSLLRPCGPITVQLIRDLHTNTNFYIEINPRFGGGAPLSMKAGAKSAEMILKLLDGEKVAYCTNIADGAVYSRFDQSVCVFEGETQIKGVIFDLDDTVYSEKEYIRSGFRAVAMFLGNERYADKLWSFFEAKKPAIDELLRQQNRKSDKDAVLNVYRYHQPSIHLYDGVAEMLKELRNRGYKIGIITDGRPDGQNNKITALGLKALVDDIIITDELGGPQFRKPCDISFRILQSRWKLSPSEIVYVGDNPTKDFQAPRQLGMKSIWFRNRDGLYGNDTCLDLKYITDITQVKDRLVK